MDAWRRNGIYYFSLVAIFLLSAYFQSQLLFNSDVSWLMLAASRMMAGGNYANDFFEVNPPLILYLYVPPVLFSNYFSVFIHNALQWYVYALSLLSLMLCAQFIESKRLMVVLAITFLLMPISDFGQREHLMVLLTSPFIFLSLVNNCHVYLRLIVGVLAGVGFAIKPYFYFTYVLLELILCVQVRSVKPLLRIESIAVFAVVISYLALIVVRHSDYLTDVIPHITQFYYQSYANKFSNVIVNNNSLYGVLALMVGGCSLRQTSNQSLYLVLMAAVFGSLLSFWCQQTIWYYHYYPVLVFSVLLIAAAFCDRIIKVRTLAMLALVVLLYYCLYLSYLTRIATFHPAAYLGLLLFVLSVVWERGLLYSAVIWLVTVLFYENAMLSVWSQHVFMLTTLLFMLMLAYSLPDKALLGKCRYVSVAIMTLIYLLYPVYQVAYLYDGNIAYKKRAHDLFDFMQQYPNKTLAFFSDSSEFAFPGVDFAGQKFASRYGCLGGLPALMYQDTEQAYQSRYTLNKGISDFVINTVVADLQRYQPDLVLVDVRTKNKNNKGAYFGNSQMDYIKYFSLNEAFKHLWQQYHYVTTIDGQPVFKFDIYERKVV